MNEYERYVKCEDKLSELCHDAKLQYFLSFNQYPAILIIRPDMEAEEQYLFECEQETTSRATSPEAFIRFSFEDGELTYKFSDSFTITDSVLAKIKQHFKNLYDCHTKLFFRKVMEQQMLNANLAGKDTVLPFRAPAEER